MTNSLFFVRKFGIAVTGAVLSAWALGCTGDPDSKNFDDSEKDTAEPVGTETEDAGDTDSLDTGEADIGFVTDAGVAYPGENWPSEDPASHGFDKDVLEEAAAGADDADTHCLMVVHDGYVIGEWYFDDWDRTTAQNVHSITKSITSAAVGIASDMGYLDVTDNASQYISKWQNTESESVTVANLLSQTSGRYWDFSNDYIVLGGSSDKTAFAVGLAQEYAPGEQWEYNNAAVQTLERVMTEATGKALDEFATEHLLSKIGMSSTFSKDNAGNTIAFIGFSATCADLARFGYLLLRHGRWGNEQIISEEYLDAALSPSSELNTAYGYLFWLNRDGHWITPSLSDTERYEGDGIMHPTLPENLVMAQGMQDQLIVVSPDDDLVIARIGGEGDPVTAFMSGNFGDNAFVESLISTILASKDETSR